MATVPIDVARLNQRLAEIQDGLPRGYKVALLCRHPENQKAHVLITDLQDDEILRTLNELRAPDTIVTEPTPA